MTRASIGETLASYPQELLFLRMTKQGKNCSFHCQFHIYCSIATAQEHLSIKYMHALFCIGMVWYGMHTVWEDLGFVEWWGCNTSCVQNLGHAHLIKITPILIARSYTELCPSSNKRKTSGYTTTCQDNGFLQLAQNFTMHYYN